MLAVVWDKYKDWQKFRTTIRWVTDEVKEVKESLEVKFNELPSELKEKVKIAQEKGTPSVDSSELLKLPSFEMTTPYKTSAWQTFIANGYGNKLKEENYKILSDAYNTLEGGNFIKGLATTLLLASSSPVFDETTKKNFVQQLRLIPIFPVIFALPKMRDALEKLVDMEKSGSWRSFISFTFM